MLDSYEDQRTFLLTHTATAWPDCVDAVTHKPREQPVAPYKVIELQRAPGSWGPGNNSVSRNYIWAISYVFKPDPTGVVTIDVVKKTKAAALGALIQVINVGTYGYKVIVHDIIFEDSEEVVAKGLAGVTLIWGMETDEPHHA